jgi:hypothetical protein
MDKIVVAPEAMKFAGGDPDSAGGSSPMAVRVPGGYLIQGRPLDDSTITAARALAARHGTGSNPAEVIGFVPDSVIEQLTGQ